MALASKLWISRIILPSLLVALTITGFGLPVQAMSSSTENQNTSEITQTTHTSPHDLAQKLTQDPGSLVSNTMLVKFKQPAQNTSAPSSLQTQLVRTLGVSNIPNGEDTDMQLVSYSFNNISELRNALQTTLSNPSVEYAQPIFRYKPQAYTPADPDYNGKQWNLKDSVAGIYAPSGWDYLGTRLGVTCGSTGSGRQCGGTGSTKIAVIDSGVNSSLSDAPAFYDSSNALEVYYNNSNACDGAGESVFASGVKLDTGAGTQYFNFCQKTGLSNQSDEEGHGSAVASVIAMNNNSTGGIGLAYNTQILPISLHRPETWNSYTIAKVLDYVVSKGAKVVNMSFGGPLSDNVLKGAVDRASSAGVILVASAGNCGVWTRSSCDFNDNGLADSDEINPPLYPAAYGNVISVGASNYGTNTNAYDSGTNSNGIRRSQYSEYGQNLFVVAPVGDGSNSPSGVWAQCGLVPANPGLACYGKTIGAFDSFLGTSFSAPQVSALVGLMVSLNPNLTISSVKSILSATSTDSGVAGYDSEFGYGIINVKNTLQIMFNGWSTDGQGSTIDKPETIAFQSKLYQAVRGSDSKIYTRSSSDGETGWSSWITDPQGNTPSSVAMGSFGGKLYQAVRGSTDNKIYTRSSSDGASYSSWVQDPISYTPDSVRFTTFNGKLYQSARGTQDKIYTRSTSDGINWSTWSENGGSTPNAIATTVFNSQFCQAVRGSTDNKIYTRCSTDGITWPAWDRDDASYTPKAIDMATNNSTWYQTAVGATGIVYIRSRTVSAGWTAWTEQSWSSPSTPVLASFNSKIYQTIRGQDNKLYWRSKD